MIIKTKNRQRLKGQHALTLTFLTHKKLQATAILLAPLLLWGCIKTSNQTSDDTDYKLNHLTLGISFPPVANHEQRELTAPVLHELGVRHIRIGEDWSFREPTKGNFTWQSLDERIAWAESNGYKVLLTLQSKGPDWACSALKNDRSCVFSDDTDFKQYVEQLLQRYRGKLYKIQFGNEWQSPWWYIGSPSQFAAASNIVYDAIQTYSPTTTFVLGGFSTIALRYLAGCDGAVSSFYDDDGNHYDQAYLDSQCHSDEINTARNTITHVLQHSRYDEIDIHLYDDVEQWDEYYFNLLSLVSKPVIVTEFGGPNINLEPSSEEYQAEQLAKYIRKLDSLALSEAYFFTLVEGITNNAAHAASGLIINNNALTKKEAYATFMKFSSNEPRTEP